MNRTFLLAASLLALGLSGCSSGTPEAPASPPADPWVFDAASSDLADRSCTAGEGEGFAMSFVMQAEPVDLGSDEDVGRALTGVEFVSGWALDAPLASFGGLSGMDILPGGDLLAVSDAGALVRIPFDQTALAPQGQATLTYLRGGDGEILTGKSEADAEGLHVEGGIAFVSFERDHRVEAFAHARCGGNARAVPVASMGSRPTGLGRSISDNSGAEGLVLSEGKLLLGLETLAGGDGPLGVVTKDGGVSFAGAPWVKADGTPLVGLDAVGTELYSLHRAYNPLTRQNAISIRVRDDGGETKTLAFMAAPLTLDNFEAIAVLPLDDGRRRIFILSDDNFSDDQRTLLYVFETTDPA
ncbi:MAG TPA: hypothetical protein EYG02_01400 [Henriciella marina]|uniref:esterase-like activity of phytase family protein n=1 Tax=Henriciella sp. TaxID=1968823 RepID=UPI00181F7119|nr:esterase-like activity of phytase family protein [Henriciella sp.]HIG22278.1 hypothetical protein [Henriciella sp.]HIK63669.1 hypothetical protein [Henriciella marina]